MAIEKYNYDLWTISQIKSRNQINGGYFFSRETMRFFHNTMRDFSVRHIEEKVYVINKSGGSVYRFNVIDGDLTPLRDEDIPVEIDRDQLRDYEREGERRRNQYR